MATTSMSLEESTAVMTEVLSLLEAETTSTSATELPFVSTQPDIPALREQLAVLVSTGKAKEAIGVQLTHEEVKRLSHKDVEKYTKRYQAYVGSKTTESLIDSFLFLATKAVGNVVKVKDIDAYQKEMKNDYIINKELSELAGNAALKGGRCVAVANAVMITAKHIDYDELNSEQIVSKAQQIVGKVKQMFNDSSEKNTEFNSPTAE